VAIDLLSDINAKYKDVMQYSRIDRLMVRVLWWHFGVLSLLAVLNSYFKIPATYPSPFGWRVMSIAEGTVAIVLGLIVVAFTHWWSHSIKNHYSFRLWVTTAFTIYSYLFVFISGGSIEMHFHFFMIIALLIVYADWRLGWLLLVLTGLHHGVLNYAQPGWVYFYGRNDFAVISHALPVLASVIFTTIITQYHREALVELDQAKNGLELTVTERTNQLREANQSLEQKVSDRTEQLQQKLSEVEELNEVMVGRELKLAEQKEEIEKLKGVSRPNPELTS
jgi:hypothetical protein